MIEPIAVLGLVGIAAARDDVKRQAATAHLIERGGLARGQARRHEAGPMGDQIGEPLRVGGRIPRDHEALG